MLKLKRYYPFLALIILLGGGLVLFFSAKDEPDYLHQVEVPASSIHIFKNVKGPVDSSTFSIPLPASWTTYHENNPSALAILLTDTVSNWLGLVHGLKNIGIPFVITIEAKEAILHSTVLVYPVISGKVLSQDHLRMIAAVPRNGGTLIGINVLGGGLNEVFGFDDVIPANGRSAIKLSVPLAGITDIPTNESEISLANPADFPDAFPTNGYTNARTPLYSYRNDSTACITYKDYGKGKAFAVGIDLGNYFLRYMNARGFNAYRKYANQYDPGMDVILKMLRQIYITSASTSVTLGTVPFNKSLSVLVTHDVDFSKSLENAIHYAAMEKRLGIRATYFIQTKYIKDWNDEIFFDDHYISLLSKLEMEGMEIGSHSISHSRAFSKLPLGTGKEYYPEYRPFVQNQTTVYNASIMGELRVSKFLLENFLKNTIVTSFRPGHLENPFSLPEALDAAGFKYSSSVTANNVQTHLPYMNMYNRGFVSETGIVEVPVTVEDELGSPLIQRLDSTLLLADRISSYGGVLNILIHTNITGHKLEFEERLLTQLKAKAWIGTLNEFGKWWSVRDKLRVLVETKPKYLEITVSNPASESINGVSVQLPTGHSLINTNTEIIQMANVISVSKIDAGSKQTFRMKRT